MHAEEPQLEGTEQAAAATVADQPPADPDGGRFLLDPWSSRDEARAVPEILEENETIVAVGSGTVVRTARLAQSGWLLVVTDRRLLCIKGKTGNRKVIKIPVHAIRGATVAGLLSKTLTLDTTTGALRVSSIKKAVAESLMLGIQSVMKSD